MEDEIWKDIEGFENYQVSNLGRVKSLDRDFINGKPLIRKGKILKPSFNGYGYLRVSIYKNNTVSTRKVHRLVADAFICNPNNLPQVNHINSIKVDNNVKNLERVSNRENTSHWHKKRKTTSIYTGVCKRSYGWQSTIYVGEKRVSLGSFKTELEAHHTYLKALEQYDIKNKYV